MANDWFQFKQFTIVQDQCAMKVSTDACIQGAYFAQWLSNNNYSPQQILDIGTGTGLLSLMMLQAFPQAQGLGVEIDSAAFEQAQYNFSQSPWFPHLQVLHQDCNAFATSITKPQWDTIICNPPFFHQHLVSSELPRKTARHSDTLSKATLAVTLKKALLQQGYACILYPSTEWQAWEAAATAESLHCVQLLHISPNANKTANRIIGIYSLQKPTGVIPTDTLIIYNAPQQYSENFKRLLQGYYLYL